MTGPVQHVKPVPEFVESAQSVIAVVEVVRPVIDVVEVVRPVIDVVEVVQKPAIELAEDALLVSEVVATVYLESGLTEEDVPED